MSRLGLTIALAAFVPLAACKPPPTDADMARGMPEAAPTFASEPLPSPETEGAMWAPSPQNDARLLYGIPEQPALVALECLDAGSAAPSLQLTRLSPADEDAEALLALVGNGHIGRLEVDAEEVGGRIVWRGELLASDLAWEPLAGPRQVTLTVPGAGMVTLNPSEAPAALVSECRGVEAVAAPEVSPIP
ncbi:hypothetical protein [uncultured Erythrobacter sp.]|uniref:hypothetical protein n=1 Tax=uncultured Erythrobacter sp. TaxID=263913 RepID=UPI00262C3E4C|nr:hypothetical protein [uncultured Erythrobacter sp.]